MLETELGGDLLRRPLQAQPGDHRRPHCRELASVPNLWSAGTSDVTLVGGPGTVAAPFRATSRDTVEVDRPIWAAIHHGTFCALTSPPDLLPFLERQPIAMTVFFWTGRTLR